MQLDITISQRLGTVCSHGSRYGYGYIIQLLGKLSCNLTFNQSLNYQVCNESLAKKCRLGFQSWKGNDWIKIFDGVNQIIHFTRNPLVLLWLLIDFNFQFPELKSVYVSRAVTIIYLVSEPRSILLSPNRMGHFCLVSSNSLCVCSQTHFLYKLFVFNLSCSLASVVSLVFIL